MAVDIRQLTIGSHVSVDGKRHRVVAVNSLSVERGVITYTTNSEGEQYLFSSKIEDVEPIPLTVELLEELGFEHYFEHIHKHWWKEGFHISHVYGSVYFDFGERQEIRIQYLHELENLYYLIYEQELIKD